jgi:calcineurin-like phosphoesterase family protein
MSELFLTSDPHFGHANIIKYCNRPFSDVYEMNDVLVKKWNQRVKNEDTIIINGDFCFRNSSEVRGEGMRKKSDEYIDLLNGQKIFIKCNHDKNNSVKTHIESLVLNWGGQRFYVVHNPEEANHNFEINLVGHVHQNWKFKRIEKKYPMLFDVYLINVGVDVWDFYPHTIGEILSKYYHWKKHLGGAES